MKKVILFLILSQIPLIHFGQIIADHRIIADFDKIPAYYINEVKKMWFDLPGESHGAGVCWGVGYVQQDYGDTYKSIYIQSGTPEAYTTDHLRISEASWGDISTSSGWIYSYGEEDWWTTAAAIVRTKTGLSYCSSIGLAPSAFGFGWCSDMDWLTVESTGTDPVYGCHWFGMSDGGPEGSRCWGLDDADNAVTGNTVNLDTYLNATQQYIDYCTANSIPTKVFFTTGPVNNLTTCSDEAEYQSWLKMERIRDYVKADTTRILFDYADILCYDDDGTESTRTWNGHTIPCITATNLGSQTVGHIGRAGCLRLGKAVWWMLARMAGWDGGTVSVPVTGITVTGAGGATTIATDKGTLQLSAAITPDNATNKTITWSLTNETGQGTINSTGLVTAAANGTVTARATANDGSGVYGTLLLTLSNQDITVPTVNTNAITNITQISVQSGGNITSDGGSPVIAKGVCWGTSPSPTADLITKTVDGTGPEPFTSTLTGLAAGTTYYLRAYSTNIVGTGYGSNEITFKTYNSNAIQDVESNYYNIVTIGSQVWLAGNLKTTSYNDGTSIPPETDDAAWAALSTPGYCWYNNDITNKSVYGALYNWYAVNTGNLCPTAWHVPSDDEWTMLETYLTNNGYGFGGDGNDIAKSISATSGWDVSSVIGSVGNDQASNNSSGFNALPGGTRYLDGGIFSFIYYNGIFWSGTFNYTRSLFADRSDIFRGSFSNPEYGFSVRCLKDLTAEQSVSLTEGWNIVSFAVEPTDMSIRTIVDPLISADALVKVQDEKGRAIEELSDPIGWIDEIGQMSVTEGYKIRVVSNATLSSTGQPITLPIEIPLETGWNIIGYPVMSSQSSATAFNSLITASTLMKVQNEVGESIEEIEGVWNYGFLNLIPGEGYKVKTNAGTTLTISSAGKGETMHEEKAAVQPVHFKPVYKGNGLDHMNIYLDRPTAGGTGLKSGDEIGVFNGEICVGACVVDGTESRYLQVIVSLDDPTTEITDGFTEGNEFELRLWDSHTGMERKTQNMEACTGYDKTFERLGKSVLKVDFEGIPRSFLGDAYPNPSTDRTILTFQLAGESRVRLEIFDVTGDLVKILVNETMQEGIYKIEWDNQTSTGNKAKAGMYFYRLQLSDLMQIKQLVIH